MATNDKIAESIKVEVYPNHVIPLHSVTIGIETDTPEEVCYHFISPERALLLLAQLQENKDVLEQMAKVRESAENG